MVRQRKRPVRSNAFPFGRSDRAVDQDSLTSIDPADPNFMRPVADSALAKEGWVEDPSFGRRRTGRSKAEPRPFEPPVVPVPRPELRPQRTAQAGQQRSRLRNAAAMCGTIASSS